MAAKGARFDWLPEEESRCPATRHGAARATRVRIWSIGMPGRQTRRGQTDREFPLGGGRFDAPVETSRDSSQAGP